MHSALEGRAVASSTCYYQNHGSHMTENDYHVVAFLLSIGVRIDLRANSCMQVETGAPNSSHNAVTSNLIYNYLSR
jgi:hypothetical protein